MIQKDRTTSLDHLARVESTLRPYELPYLDLLLAMLTIQTAFINYANESGYAGLDRTTFDATGFPELPSWLADLKGAFEQFEQSRRNRAKAIIPLLGAFANASPDPAKTEQVAREISANRTLAVAIGTLSAEKQKYLSTAARLAPEAFPLSVRPDNLGVLTARSSTTKFNTIQPKGANTFIKFVDMPDIPNFPPGNFTLYAVPKHTLSPTIHILQPRAKPVKADESISKNPTLDQIENYHPALLKALYELDSTTTKPETVSDFICLLSVINKLIIDFTRYYREEILPGKPMTEAEFNLRNQQFVRRQEEIYIRLAHNPVLVSSVQIAIATALAPIKEEAEKLMSSPIPGSSAALTTVTPTATEPPPRGFARILGFRKRAPEPPMSDLARMIAKLESTLPPSQE